MNQFFCTHAFREGRCNAQVSRVRLTTHDDGRVYETFNCDRCMKPARDLPGIKMEIVTLDEWQVMQIMRS